MQDIAAGRPIVEYKEIIPDNNVT